jgi:hemin uptake protein HemP
MDPRTPHQPPAERTVALRRDARGGWWVSSGELLGTDTRLAIVHEGEPYQLRVTRQNKLILTK